ncbi:phospholipid carrier-dependent glycosyltransferase [bacterium]|nr:phospholipid carrier-dependent glycosyltransferase [bacterium]
MTKYESHPARSLARWQPIAEFTVIFLLVLVSMTKTIRDIPMVWDEGATVERIEKIEQGWKQYQLGQITFSQFTDTYWRFSRAEPDGHSPFYALLSMAGHVLTVGILDPPASFRFGGVFLFSLAVAMVYATLRARWSFASALITTILLVSIPRVVPEVSFALTDGPLFSLSLIGWSIFVRIVERQTLRSTIAFGIVMGLAMGTKLTGWFLSIPYVIWLFTEWRSPHFRALLTRGIVAGTVSLLVVFLINVGWWPDPVQGISAYFHSNLTRKETIPIPILFGGVRYEFSLPWYNTLVWTVIAMPLGILMLGGTGVLLSFRQFRSSWFARLLLLNWLTLIVVRALPQAPGHDGTRQIIISFGFLTLLAGWMMEQIRLIPLRSNWNVVASILIGIAAASESVGSVLSYHPLELSYYSPLVGGLPGAEKRGFEPTYFWDSLTPEVLDWLNQHTSPGRSILFRNYTLSLRYLEEWGILRHPTDPRLYPPQWFVIQHRPGLYNESDRRLLAKKPAFEKSLFGVPLLSIYPIEAWQESLKDVPPEKSP